MTETSEIQITTNAEMVLARVDCEHMEEQQALALQTGLIAAAQQAGQLPVVVDLSRVAIMPSIAIGALVAIWKWLNQNKRRLIIGGVQPKVRELLVVCRLDKLLEICETMDEAKSRLRQSP